MATEIFKIVLIALTTLSCLTTILLIGKDRKPITPISAAFVVFINAWLIVGIVFLL